MEELNKDELWEIYRNLPETLKDAIFSEDTADAIWNICQINKIKQVSEVAKLCGRVLMGLLPPENFEQALKHVLKLEPNVCHKASKEIEHYVFNPVKDELDFLYEKEKKQEKESQDKNKESDLEQKPSPPPKPAPEDTYREPID